MSSNKPNSLNSPPGQKPTTQTSGEDSGGTEKINTQSSVDTQVQWLAENSKGVSATKARSLFADLKREVTLLRSQKDGWDNERKDLNRQIEALQLAVANAVTELQLINEAIEEAENPSQS